MAIDERTPAGVAAGSERNTTLVRLELPDRPGSLAIVAGVLGRCGVNILQLEVLSRSDGVAVDELLLEGGSLDLALRRLGPYVTVRELTPHGTLPDPGIAMAEACASIVTAATPDHARRALLEAAKELARADTAELVRAAGDGGVAARAVIPLPAAPPLALAVTRHDGLPFAPVELGRLEGLARIAGDVLGHSLV
jgi:hypothetical protein